MPTIEIGIGTDVIPVYDASNAHPVSNTLLLNQQSIFDSGSYDPTAGPLSIQINGQPAQGTLQVIDGYDFVYTPDAGATGMDGFTFEVLQNGLSLVGEQSVEFILDDFTSPSQGTEAANITFLDWELSANNSDAALFLPDTLADPIDPIIELSVQVEGVSPGSGTPEGEVHFTYTDGTGTVYSLGTASIEMDGIATIEVDSGILAREGVVVTVDYSGDEFFTATTANDGGNLAAALRGDPPGDNLTNVPATATNLTIVVVRGRNAAQTEQWRDSARAYYGAGAWVVTTVHSVDDLAAALQHVPAASVSHLVIGAHGWEAGASLGDETFNALNVNSNPDSKAIIRAALANNALIDLQCCGAAHGANGQANMQALANALNARVRGADDCINSWDDNSVSWITLGSTAP